MFSLPTPLNLLAVNPTAACMSEQKKEPWNLLEIWTNSLTLPTYCKSEEMEAQAGGRGDLKSQSWMVAILGLKSGLLIVRPGLFLATNILATASKIPPTRPKRSPPSPPLFQPPFPRLHIIWVIAKHIELQVLIPVPQEHEQLAGSSLQCALRAALRHLLLLQPRVGLGGHQLPLNKVGG